MVVGIFIVTNIVIAIIVSAAGHDFVTEDVGDCTGHDVFSKMQSVATYADKRLEAAATSQPLPKPPIITADIFTLRAGFIATLVSEVAFLGVVMVAGRIRPRDFVSTIGLGTFDLRSKWVPIALALLANVGVSIYAIVMQKVDQCGPLTPVSTVPTSILQDNTSLWLAGAVAVIGAPICEEVLFRGFFFRGLLKLGFAPAALASAALFAGSHLDPGSLIPFTGIGLLMAYLFWRRGSLWDSMTFHCAFNSASFVLLLASR